MSYRPERERQGYCRLLYRNGKTQDIRRNEYEPLTAALQANPDTGWYQAEDLYGDQLIFRHDEIAGVADCSPAALDAFEAEEAERRAHEKTHGED
jgi:hypothetical protein